MPAEQQAQGDHIFDRPRQLRRCLIAGRSVHACVVRGLFAESESDEHPQPVRFWREGALSAGQEEQPIRAGIAKT